MKLSLAIFSLAFTVAFAAGGGVKETKRRLWADPEGPAVIKPLQDDGDIGEVNLELLEATYDGFCSLCSIAGIINADQIFCILCDFDLDQDDVDGQDPDQFDVSSLCFSEKSTVQVQGVGSVPMRDLDIGANVLTQGGRYEPMYAWGHKNPTKQAKFLQLHTKEAILEMTGGHLVFLDGKKNPVRADSIKVGDTLAGKEELVVKKIGIVSREGVYSPLTPSGTVVVDGILASSYISLQKDSDEYLEFQGGISTHLSFQEFIHTALSPFRMLCMGISSRLGNIYTEDGIPVYASVGLNFARWAEKQNIVVQVVLFLFVGALSGASMFVENTFGATYAPLAAVVVALIFAASRRASIENKVKSL